MQPQPSTQTTARKRSRGRPALIEPRRTTLPRVSATAHAHLLAYARAHRLSLADALQSAILAVPSPAAVPSQSTEDPRPQTPPHTPPGAKKPRAQTQKPAHPPASKNCCKQ
jgi:hypothetical protein